MSLHGFFIFNIYLYICLFIYCRPTPQVEWNKLGGDLPKGRETKENYGKTLKIENISFQDKGNYRCTAQNSLGIVSHDFHVIVEGMFPMMVSFYLKNSFAGCWWLMPVILAIQEPEIKRSWFEARQNSSQNPILKKPSQKRTGRVA
jgi:hypothetical protein